MRSCCYQKKKRKKKKIVLEFLCVVCGGIFVYAISSLLPFASDIFIIFLISFFYFFFSLVHVGV